MPSPEEVEYPAEIPFFLRPDQVLSTEPATLRAMAEKTSGVGATILAKSADFLIKVNELRHDGIPNLPEADPELIRQVVETHPTVIKKHGLTKPEMAVYITYLRGPKTEKVTLRGYLSILLSAVRNYSQTNPEDPDLASAKELAHKLLAVQDAVNDNAARRQKGKLTTKSVPPGDQKFRKTTSPPQPEAEYTFFDPATGKTTTRKVKGPRKFT
ncbi:hypothetical protein A2691_01340 [Candidatus Woesebacteria bacterium RIFCSPHIGHO2_01_FULL_39_23]|nr:MAG: hypothetical protein A2691_01340 [Candidatus Woesebacteria bacterium RIFCSPHIGHO2_01_FULL_39_23]